MIKTPILAFTTALTISLASATAGSTKVYLGTQGRGESKGIYLCDLNTTTGALSKPKLAATLSGCGFLAIHPSRKYLYSTARGDG
ncbi:MAG: beta-propeller fold lactonase family protein, partial [Verrucomicrobiota bacterium]|nr:beta-propeller fold lactonase family protein [Verrucomicrobiota bacterium]